MHPEQEIAALQQVVDEILGILQQAISSGEDVPDELQAQVAEILNDATNRIQELSEPEVEAPPPETNDLNLLWVLSGGKQDAFISYLNTFPGTGFKELANNPERLAITIEELQTTNPQQPSQEAGGVPKADLNSSNIYGFHYDPASKRLLVRFQSGSVYGYQGVPPGIFNIFQQGAVPAKTTGQNSYGKWWKGKIPSLGASFYELIRNGGYPYQRLT